MWRLLHRTGLVGLACLLLSPSLSAGEHSYFCVCEKPLIFPKFECADLTLREFIEFLRVEVQKCDLIDRPPSKPNIVLDAARLTPEQLSARISMNEKDIRVDEIIHVVCKGLGIGYRRDPHALVISSRARFGLPDPPTPRTSVGPDGARQHYLVFAAYRPTT